ncbi:L-cystine transport system permease protein YecS [Jeotgalibaca dankookensis]|uniref:L-cystine transport system permease protein YecS n=1 Tax=Jeotgalibaca dankookensis TaxID=708126 RepID=A0A1S6IM00_9LACT|nr:amino acid ABC transporter permease [Jeotgalibaca dankookensis]AQS52588.1 L-cystine transport system permease protein YecS [Jeotgalibaca dankookensis]
MAFSDIKWEYIFNIRLAIDNFGYVVSGIGYTLLISAVGFLLGLVLGFLLSLMRISSIKLVSRFAKLYISFMRGTPTLVLLFILYFGFPFIGIYFQAVVAAIIGFSLSSAAYIAEIIRSALNAIDQGQWEAGMSLGLSRRKVLWRIIVPQALRIAVPPLSNVVLDLVKSSSLAAMITVPDIFQKAKIVGGRENDYMTVYIMVALIYWAICSLYEVLQAKLEKEFGSY